MQPSAALSTYRANYPLKPMRIEPANSDQIILMTTGDGLLEMPAAPANNEEITRPKSLPNTSEKAAQKMSLLLLRNVNGVENYKTKRSNIPTSRAASLHILVVRYGSSPMTELP